GADGVDHVGGSHAVWCAGGGLPARICQTRRGDSHHQDRGQQPGGGTLDRLWCVRSGLLYLLPWWQHRFAVLPRGAADTDLRYRRYAVGLADPGAADGAGGDRLQRRRSDTDSPLPARRLPGAGRDQIGNPVEDQPADVQPGDDDRSDPGGSPRGWRSSPADAGRCGQAGTVTGGEWQLSLSAPGPEVHAPWFPYL